ncbi:uncharacterized protein B0J16DRAFT_375044 [Fusarium flagelliforme]|uniref:uncharacterized protein n=1 Tax=Fusarium flagelliforme TaxID=2675880 RepID=UPI001E8D4BCA|nr:uncharacterized protein B0J16DRAFT_375044 [Fusarium flagelliforme]KAH7174119.1 hypothetical protein B0J16DRAFT_375044 [Fusarium flagelliforme]
MSASGDWGPAPEGIDLTEQQDGEILRPVIALMTMGIMAVAIRFVARFKSGTKIAIDDYLILLALPCALGTAALCIVSIPYGGGRHLWVVTFTEFTSLWKMAYSFVPIYATTVTLTKASILMFYQRVFGINIAHHICMGLVIGWYVAIIIAWFAGCRPASYFWEQFTDPGTTGYCMDTSLFYFVNGICAMLIDIAVLCVPIPTILKLQMPNRQKVAVGGILLLGAFVCVASIVRIVYMDKLVKATDFTWAMAQVFIWSCCEPFVGIVCACLPTFGPLLRRWFRTATSTAEGKNNSDSWDKNKPRSQWKPYHGGFKLRQDDELELTVDVSHGDAQFESKSGSSIYVQNEFTWASGGPSQSRGS